MPSEKLQQTLERVYAEQRRVLIGMIVGMVGNPATAEELVHEAYLRVAASTLTENAVASPRAFLFRTARNLAIDYLRRRARERRIFDVEADDATVTGVAGSAPTPEDFARHRQSMAILDAALTRVPARARRVLILSRIHGLSFERIASRLGISPTTVRKDFRRAMAACLRAAEENDFL